MSIGGMTHVRPARVKVALEQRLAAPLQALRSPLRVSTPPRPASTPLAAPKFRPPFHGTVRIVFSLILFVLGPISWFGTIDNAELRASGATVWSCFVSALYLGVTAAWKDRRRWVRVVFAGELVFTALSLWLFFGFARLPQPGERSERAPDFTLLDQDGASVTLSAELAKGPVLLFFTRGHW
jgi:hypothetical protein